MVLDKKLVSQIQQSQQISIEDYFARVQKDELAFKNLLQKTHYSVASDNAKSSSNPEGFVFTEEDHKNLIKESFEDYKSATFNVSEASIKSAAIRARLESGTKYSSEREFNKIMSKALSDIKCFNEMAGARDHSFKLSYTILADREIFDKGFDIENTSIQELQKGLTKQEIKKTAQKSLFNLLIGFTSFRRCLFLPSFQKGLERILKVN